MEGNDLDASKIDRALVGRSHSGLVSESDVGARGNLLVGCEASAIVTHAVRCS